MSNPIRHHFVPQVILRNFTDSTGWLHGYDKRNPDRGVFRTKPEKLFVERHLYSLHGADGVRNPAGEISLGKLEDMAAPIIDRIIKAARLQQLPCLTLEDRAIWDQFFIVQWSRSPDTRQNVVPDRLMVEFFEDAVRDLSAHLPEGRAEIDELRHPRKMAEMVHDARVHSLFDPRPQSRAALGARGIAVVWIDQPRWSFVVGSRPVVKLAIQGASDLADARTEMWLPIAHDVVVGLGSFDEPETGLVLKTQKPVRELNAAIVQQSSSFAARSPILTKSLAHPRCPKACWL